MFFFFFIQILCFVKIIYLKDILGEHFTYVLQTSGFLIEILINNLIKKGNFIRASEKKIFISFRVECP